MLGRFWGNVFKKFHGLVLFHLKSLASRLSTKCMGRTRNFVKTKRKLAA